MELRLQAEAVPRLGGGQGPLHLPHGMRGTRETCGQVLARRGPRRLRLQAGNQGATGRRIFTAGGKRHPGMLHRWKPSARSKMGLKGKNYSAQVLLILLLSMYQKL